MLEHPRPVVVRTSLALAFSGLAALPAPAALAAAGQQLVPYPALDHVQGTHMQTAAAPVRPVLIDAAGQVWAVNTDDSTVESFAAIDQEPLVEEPLDVRPVPWGPVSIAEWINPAGGEELLIVCRNTWGLLRMNKDTGSYREFIPLLAEPSDIVVDPVANRAFVSCTGADAVIMIDLTLRDGKFHRLYDETTTGGDLRLKSPYFLSLDAGLVRVAPLHSGNNTTVVGTQFDSTADRVISVAGRTVSPGSVSVELPDEDLFQINPAALDLTSAVSVVAKGVGTILFGHGKNPSGGQYWMLNTEALNAPAGEQSEPALGFDFVDNRVTFVGSPNTFVGFDRDSAGFDAARAIGQPFALAFGGGWTFVTGLLTDNVTVLDASGARVSTFALAEGSIPRGLAVLPGTPTRVAVHCWGTSRIEVLRVDAAGAVTSPGGYSLRHTPLSSDLVDGRQTFFDGALSARGNVSCASCHVDGGTDFLAWNLSGLPYDDKGPMVTQTLIGLERVSPFHWRGERSFEDFNTFAFKGLLGNPGPSGPEPIDETEFAKMKAWLFSLKNPANPFQNRNRVVDGTLAPPEVNPATFVSPTQPRLFRSDLTALQALDPNHPLVGPVPDGLGGTRPNPIAANAVGGNAARGLERWQATSFPGSNDDLIFQSRWACVQCHAFPVGTNNDVTDDEAQDLSPLLPERMHFKNTPFHEIWRKKQSLVAVDTAETANTDPSAVDVRTFLGTGVQHAGSVPDVLRFAQFAGNDDDNAANFALTTASFVQQWDQGLAPAAHFGFWLNGRPSQAEITAELVDFLLLQASRDANEDPNGDPNGGIPNCDIAVFQLLPSSRKAWYLNRTLATNPTITRNDIVFTDDDATGPSDNRSLQWFINQAKSKAQTNPPQTFLILGLPVGMAERFAVDYDMDGKKNKNEPANLLYVPDAVNDSLSPLVQSEIGYVTTNTARVYVRTDFPTTVTVEYNEGSGVRTMSSPLLSRVHSLILPDLRPSTSAQVTSNPDDPPGSGTPVSYAWTIHADDADGERTTVSGAPTITTGSFSTPIAGDSAGFLSPVAQLRNEHVLTDPPLVTVGERLPTPGGHRVVTVELSASLKQGPLDTPATNRIFAVRAFLLHGTEPPRLLFAGAPDSGILTGLFGTRIVDQIVVGTTGAVRAIQLPGLIVNEAPDPSSGSVTLTFRVDGDVVQAGDKVVVHVEAVVESTGTPPTFIGCGSATVCDIMGIETLAATALSQWDFPRTKEVNSQGEDTAP